MRWIRSFALFAAFSSAWSFSAAHADEAPDAAPAPARLTVGDAAPAVDIGFWIKGVEMDRRGDFQPLTTWAPGKVFLLEFWATWCGPCVMSMPHLSELQETHGAEGFQVIGVSDESLPKVVEFLFKTFPRDGKVHNDRARYTLATDPDRSTRKAFFDAAGRTGIPCGFLIGKTGLIEWIGHPSRVDSVVEQVLADSWDRDAFKAEYEEAMRVQLLRDAFFAAYRPVKAKKDWAACLEVLEEKGAGVPGLEMEKATVLLIGLGRYDEGFAVLRDWTAAAQDDAKVQNQIAWFIATDKGLTARDLDLALAAAGRARDLTKGNDPAILDTLAHVLHACGDLDRAIEIQTDAVARAEGSSLHPSLKKTLEAFQAEREARAPQADTPSDE